MIPSAEMFGKVIDCRCLEFRAVYFRLDRQQTFELAKAFHTFVTSMYGNSCVLSWELEDRSLRSIDMLSELNSPYFFIGLHGDVVSSSVYNKTSLRAYEKKLRNSPIFDQGITPPFSSLDYPAYAVQNLQPYQTDPQALQNKLMQLFSLENRINLDLYHEHDIFGFFDNYPYEGCESLFAGTLEFSISCYSLEDELDAMSEQLHQFGMSLSEQFININITVGIAQTPYDYERYFGGAQIHPTTDPKSEKAFLLMQRAKCLYMQCVGWSNIISPFLCKRIQHAPETVEDAHILCSVLKNSALNVKARAPISGTTLDILRRIKQAMYPVMYPGIMKFPVDYPYFRSRWQNVPILDGELTVIQNKVFVRYKGYFDEEYLLDG